ncbi:MAG: hypothetical protein N2517_08210 [Ignavibacteria bacterium]|nr:hypothetical protein [Ignavibacteria bacterium]
MKKTYISNQSNSPLPYEVLRIRMIKRKLKLYQIAFFITFTLLILSIIYFVIFSKSTQTDNITKQLTYNYKAIDTLYFKVFEEMYNFYFINFNEKLQQINDPIQKKLLLVIFALDYYIRLTEDFTEIIEAVSNSREYARDPFQLERSKLAELFINIIHDTSNDILFSNFKPMLVLKAKLLTLNKKFSSSDSVLTNLTTKYNDPYLKLLKAINYYYWYRNENEALYLEYAKNLLKSINSLNSQNFHIYGNFSRRLNIQ